MSLGNAFTEAVYLQWSSDGLTSPGTDVNKLGTAQGDGYAASATFTTVPVLVKSLKAYSIQVSAPSTGSPNGTIALQSCNDIGSAENTPNVTLVNWVTEYLYDMSAGTTVTSKAVSGAFSVLFKMQNASRWIRIVWTNTSGSATLTVCLQQAGS